MVTLRQQDQEQLEKARDLVEAAPVEEQGFVRALYFGRLNLGRLMPYPRQEAEEARDTDQLLARVDAFLRQHVDPDRIDAEERLPEPVMRGLGELGVLGMTVPHEYGGGGFSHTAYCRMLERVSSVCASTAVFIAAHQSIGLKALLLNGSEAQKRRWLPGLAAGNTIAAFCLSEPEVGSDAANVQTQAQLSDDGSTWVLNGQKRYATNAALAGFMTVMARTPVQVGGETRQKVTAFIVTPDLPGFEILSPNRSKCGIRGTWQATLRFTDMQVPADRVLGELGKGLKVALTVLNYGRCTLSAGCLGAARRALAMAVERARARRQFGRPIGQFHLIKQKIARMAEWVFAMDALTYLAAGQVDRHDPDLMLETAIAKLFSSEAAWQVADDALQIWGGEGYMREHGLERMLRDARINRIVEGTTEVMTSFIGLMGMKDVGEELEQVAKAARHPVENFGRLVDFARHEWRDVVRGHTHDPALDRLHPRLAGEGRRLARLTRRLAREVSRLLATHKQGIIDLQLHQQRIAWAAAELYATAAVISKLQMRLEQAGDNDGAGAASAPDAAPGLEQDLLIGQAYCRHAAERIEARFDELSRNSDNLTLAVADRLLGFET